MYVRKYIRIAQMRRHRAASAQTKRASRERKFFRRHLRSSFSSEALLHARATERKIGSSNIGQLRDRTQQRLRWERKDPGGGEERERGVRLPRDFQSGYSRASIRKQPLKTNLSPIESIELIGSFEILPFPLSSPLPGWRSALRLFLRDTRCRIERWVCIGFCR